MVAIQSPRRVTFLSETDAGLSAVVVVVVVVSLPPRDEESLELDSAASFLAYKLTSIASNSDWAEVSYLTACAAA